MSPPAPSCRSLKMSRAATGRRPMPGCPVPAAPACVCRAQHFGRSARPHDLQQIPPQSVSIHAVFMLPLAKSAPPRTLRELCLESAADGYAPIAATARSCPYIRSRLVVAVEYTPGWWRAKSRSRGPANAARVAVKSALSSTDGRDEMYRVVQAMAARPVHRVAKPGTNNVAPDDGLKSIY